MPEPTINDVLLILARLEQKMEAVTTGLAELKQTTESQWERLNKHEVDIELLKQRQGPKAHVTAWVSSGAALIASLAAFIIWVVK